MTYDHLSGASTLLAGLPGRKGFGDASLVKAVPGSINLAGGNPDPQLLPTGLYRNAAVEHTESEQFRNSLKYVPAPGIERLRQWLADDAAVNIDRVIITSGGTHGLALSVLGTLNPGDTIVVDDPVYPLFLRILDLVDVTIVPVPVGADGISVSALESLLASGVRPSAVFTVPTFQNPSGGTLDSEHRAALVALAERYGFVILADDPYRDIMFPGTEPPDRRPFLDTDRVVEVNSFSKTLGPGLRLGWNIVPEHLAGQFTKLRNRLDGQASGFLQEIVVRIIETDEYRQSLRSAGEAYQRKASALMSALRRELSDDVEIVSPQGGFFLWFRFLRPDVDYARFFDLAQEYGVTFQRGEWFAVDDQSTQRGRVRLSFSEVSEADLQTAGSRLGEAWRALT